MLKRRTFHDVVQQCGRVGGLKEFAHSLICRRLPINHTPGAVSNTKPGSSHITVEGKGGMPAVWVPYRTILIILGDGKTGSSQEEAFVALHHRQVGGPEDLSGLPVK